MTRSDEQLLALSRDGDRQAFAELAARHDGRLARYLATMTGDDAIAEDLRQEALRLALERLDQLRSAARFGYQRARPPRIAARTRKGVFDTSSLRIRVARSSSSPRWRPTARAPRSSRS